MSVVKTEIKKGHVTFQNKLYLGGFLFNYNHQFPFDMIVWLAVGCGCNGTEVQHVKHYRVLASGNAFYIDAKYVVETDTPIPIQSQDADIARRDQHLNPGKNFTDIVAHPNPDAIWAAANMQSVDKFKH